MNKINDLCARLGHAECHESRDHATVNIIARQQTGLAKLIYSQSSKLSHLPSNAGQL